MNSFDLERKKTDLASNRRPEPISNCYSISCRSRSTSIWISSTVFLHWTDRGDPPQGNTVSRAPMDSAPRSAKAEIVFTDLMEGLGLAPDVSGDRIFMSDLKSLYTASLDGATFKMLLAVQGNLTGVAYVN